MLYNEIKGKIKSGTAFFGTLEKKVKEHIHIVLTDPIPDENDKKNLKVIVVNLSSVKRKNRRNNADFWDI